MHARHGHIIFKIEMFFFLSLIDHSVNGAIVLHFDCSEVAMLVLL